MGAYEHVNFAASFMILNDPTRALSHIEEAILQMPQFMRAHNNKAAIYASLGRFT
jgi:Tfp pilus assembly protein PilF